MCVTANLIYSFLIWCTTQENGNVAQAKNNNFCQIWFRTFSCEFQQLQLYMLKLPWQPMKECLGSEMLLLTAWQLDSLSWEMLLLSPVLLAFAPWNQICDAKSRQIQLSVANLNIRLLHSCFVFCIFSLPKSLFIPQNPLWVVYF